MAVKPLKTKLRVIELFGGIGAMTQALKRIGVDFQVVDYVEIDKYAVASYNAMNGTDYKPQDVTKWDKDIECDLIMHGSPCQDFSIAGTQKGGDKDSGTRSSLMWETVRIVRKLRPKYVIWENVKNVISDAHWPNFEMYLNAMSSIGYANAWQVLNAKDYGVPQNRERLFVVSVMNGRAVYEAVNLFGDVEKKLDFRFPKPFPLKKKLRDILEDNEGVAKTLWTETEIKMITDDGNVRRYIGSNTIDQFDLWDCADLSFPNGYNKGGRVYHGYAPTITVLTAKSLVVKVMNKVKQSIRIRKLTPLETWRLQGQTDEAFYKAREVNSDNQLYKQAGNSICVDVLYYLTKAILEQNEI